jgi:hypothetical protein
MRTGPSAARRQPFIGMTLAYGPDDEPVDIRRPGAYDRWRGRGGLRCVDCDDPVHPYRLPNGHVWLRHGATEVEGRGSTAGGAGHETDAHVALTFWLFHWLESQGLSPTYNRAVGGVRPDVQVEAGGRRLAYEVQLSPISLALARQRTETLRASGFRVLWLTRNVDWVDGLPGVGLLEEGERPAAYVTTQVHGRFYSVMEGCLAWHPERARLLPGLRRPAMETFLRKHLHGQVESGPYTSGRTGMRSGWATMDDWRRHMEWQARRIAELEANVRLEDEARLEEQRKLAGFHDQIEQERRQREAASVEAAQLAVELKAAGRRFVHVDEECREAVETARRWKDAHQRLSAAVAASPLRRRKFKDLLGDLD